MRGRMGPTPGNGPSLREMREEMIRYVDAHGLREAAREIAMSPTGLNRVIRERPHPSRPTVRKLERWFVQRVGN